MEMPCRLIGASPSIRTIEKQITQAASTDAKVLITGESGVGKEIVARRIHLASRRSRATLVTINCAGFPDSLLESELFGHVRGSFTDAHRDKRGLLEMAHGGTVFMDEMGEMSLRMQALLLRFLETGEIQRVGSDRAVPPLDVRVIAATHRRLPEHVANGSFRQDLYYRLNVMHIHVPPLRERREDVLALLAYFLECLSRTHCRPIPELSPDATKYLVEYEWPGNVRELRNLAERLVLSCPAARVELDGLPLEIEGGRPATGGAAAASPVQQASQQVSRELFSRLLTRRASFWGDVYEPFMARDLTRQELRELILLGLEHTRGNYKLLLSAFSMPPEDYKKFLNFLRKYQCHVPFQRFRMASATLRVLAAPVVPPFESGHVAVGEHATSDKR